MKTLSEVYLQGRKILEKSNNPCAAFDAMCIFKFCFNMDRQNLILNGKGPASNEGCTKFFELINERANKRPLQYIIGEWEFMGSLFKVGEGVLIPREDTETLVNECLERIKDTLSPHIADLCSGSGAVAISIAKARKDALVIAIELSEVAYSYLLKNIELNNIKNVIPLKADILKADDIMSSLQVDKFDSIVSNPPYLTKSDMECLQDEVKREPSMALFGGNDGLYFYNEIPKLWSPYLKNGGSLCVEFGINQENDIENIFRNYGFSNINKEKDINGIYRALSALKNPHQ